MACYKSLQYERDTYSLNSQTFLTKFLPASLLGMFTGYYQRALVGESRMITTQMGKHKQISDSDSNSVDA
jgi:hypothetical protein